MKILLWCQSEVLFTAEVHTRSLVNVSKKCMFAIRTCNGTVTFKHQINVRESLSTLLRIQSLVYGNSLTSWQSLYKIVITK